MKYSEIDKVRIQNDTTLQQLKFIVSNTSTDIVLLTSNTYTNIECEDFEYNGSIIIPVIVPYNHNTLGPFGKKIMNINIEPNLKIQPFYGHQHSYISFIPFAMIISKELLLRMLEKCSYSVFLELSLLAMAENIGIKIKDDWFCSIQLQQESLETRNLLSHKFGLRYELITDSDSNVKSEYFLSDRSEFRLNSLTKNFRGRSVLLVDKGSKYFDAIKNYDTTVAINSDFDADFYIISDPKFLESIDHDKAICQVSMYNANYIVPMDSRYYDCSVYGVKQFTSDISFEPPFTKSSSHLLTAIEVICYFKPFSITVMSDELLPIIMNSGNNSESIKKQIFITKIIEFCRSNNIKLNIFGDLCSIS